MRTVLKNMNTLIEFHVPKESSNWVQKMTLDQSRVLANGI